MEFKSCHDRMREWIKSPAGADLLEAMGASRSAQWHEPMAAGLSKLIRYVHGQFPLMKDHNDHALRCAPIEAYMQGDDVPREQLTTAIVLLLQAFGAAVDSNWAMKQALEQRRRDDDRRRHFPPHRPQMSAR